MYHLLALALVDTTLHQIILNGVRCFGDLKLLNLRLLEEIDAETFAKKQRELRDREADIKLRIEAADRSHHEMVDLAVKVFELSQTLRDKWLTANYPEKRQILEILCLNYRLDDVSLYVEMRKPFDVLAKGLDSEKSRGNRTPVELFSHGVQRLPTSLCVSAQALATNLVGDLEVSSLSLG